MRFPAFRVKGAVYLKVTSRPPIFLWKGVGFDPSDVKYILQSGVSEKKKYDLNKTYKIPKIFYKEEVRENSLYQYCMNFFFFKLSACCFV